MSSGKLPPKAQMRWSRTEPFLVTLSWQDTGRWASHVTSRCLEDVLRCEGCVATAPSNPIVMVEISAKKEQRLVADG
jgi:hypothetical protein